MVKNAGGGVVEQQEQGDADGRADQVPLEDLPPRVGGGGHQLLLGQAPGPRLHQGPVLLGHHQLVAKAGRQVLQEEQGEHEHHQRPSRPRSRTGSSSRRCRRWSRKWLRVWAATIEVIRLPATGPTVQKPMAEARPSWGLKSRTSAGVATRMAPSTTPRRQMTTRNCHSVEQRGHAEGHQEADDQQAVDDDVGPAEFVGLAGRQRGEGAEQVGDDHDPHVERERHVVRDQDLGGDPGLREVRVVEDDGGQHGQGQVGGPLAVGRVLVDLVDEEELEEPAALPGHRRVGASGRRCAVSAAMSFPLSPDCRPPRAQDRP